MTTEAGGGGRSREAIGARLHAARERAGLTVLQASERLHIDPVVIEALEREDFARLGAPVYVRGHLRRYAEFLGEPPDELQAFYAARMTPAAMPDLTRIAKRAPARDRPALLAPGLALLVSVAVIGTVWWAVDAFEPVQPQVASTASDAARAEQPATSEPTGTPAEAVPEAVDENPRRTAPALTAARGVSPAQAPPVVAATTGATEEMAAVPSPPPAPRTAELTLRFSADSWVEVYDARGQRLFYDIGTADTMRTLNGTPPLRVVLGNAPGVAVEVNGRPTVIPDAAMRESEARFVVNRSGRLVRSRVAAGGNPP